MERSKEKEDGKKAYEALRAAAARERLAGIEARLAAVEARLANAEAALGEALRRLGSSDGSGANWGKGPTDIYGNPVPYC